MPPAESVFFDGLRPRPLLHLVVLAATAATLMPAAVAAQGTGSGHLDDFERKPRVFVLSDVGNEPDDQMSFVRLLVYANDLEGLVATTSTWQPETVQPETVRALTAACGEVRPNLLQHAAGWLTAAALDSLVTTGRPPSRRAGASLLDVGSEAKAP